MNPIDFLKTIYVGDRACKKIIFDTWDKEVKIQITNISRVRSATWDFYDLEDLIDGYLVFENVGDFSMLPTSFLPNDYINDISIKKFTTGENYLFYLNISSVNEKGFSSEVELNIVAENICLQSANDLINKIRN